MDCFAAFYLTRVEMITYPTFSTDFTSDTSGGSRRASAPHILVVEDEISIRRLNTLVLLRNGFDVHCAEDGTAAWNALTSDDYDLVVTDHNMPNLTGRDLFFKMQQAGMELPVIFACGSLFETDSFQPAAILLKPYTIEELVAAVKRVLQENCPAKWETYPCY